MTIITKNILIENDANGQLALTIDFSYDDVTLNIVGISADNTDVRSYTVAATSTVTGAHFETVIEAGTSIDQVIPNDAITGFPLTIVGGGKLDGLSWDQIG